MILFSSLFKSSSHLRSFSFGLVLFVLAGCPQKKTYEPILISKDACHYCKMVISDKRFGAELVTEKGKVYKFDSIECFGHFHEENPTTKGTVYVVDSFSEGQMIEFKSAKFFHDPRIRSPMGKGIFATKDSETLQKKSPGAKELAYDQVFDLIGRPELKNKL